MVRIPTALVDVLRVYLAEVRPLLPASAFLFANPNAPQTSGEYGRIAPRCVNDITWKYGRAAGVAGRHNPHKWRHTYATGLLRAARTFTSSSGSWATRPSRPRCATCT